MCISKHIKMATTHASNCVKIVDNATESLLPLKGSTSKVWKHFGFPAKNGKYIEADKKKRAKICCKLCKKSLRNTLNLRAHLEQDHKKM